MRVIPLLLLLQVSLCFKLFKGVIVADDDNFEQVISNIPQGYTFMNFYSVGCEHCQALGPNYEPLATLFNNTSVQIAHVEARINKRIRNQEAIRGFPTLRLYDSNGKRIASYIGKRSTESMAEWLGEYTGVEPKWPESGVKTLVGDEFESLLQNRQDTKKLVVAFTTPWLKEWNARLNLFERIVGQFPGHELIIIDSTLEENSDVVSKYRVAINPTLIQFNDQGLRVLEHSNVGESDVVEFLENDDLGSSFACLDELHQAKAAYHMENEPQKKLGFNRFTEGSELDDDEMFKRLREL